MTFREYLNRVNACRLLVVIVPLLPFLMRDIWQIRRLPPARHGARITRPMYAGVSLAMRVVMMVQFVFGENLRTRIVPPVIALIASALALLVGYAERIEPTENE